MKRNIVAFGIILSVLLITSINSIALADNETDRIKTIAQIGTLSNSGQYETALEKCKTALKKYPQDAELYYWSASIKSEMGDNKAAIKDYSEAIKINPKDGNAFVMRGIIKTELKDFNSAIADFNRAIAINPKDASAYSMRACTKLEMGDLDGASKDLQIANRLYDEGEK